MRDYRKLRTFALADSLLLELYAATRRLPAEERYGLQAQLRRAALSVPTNIVEGSTRRTTREYLHFLQIAFGSALEVWYLLGVSERLEFLAAADTGRLKERYDHLVRMLYEQMQALRKSDQTTACRAVSRKP
jgi:four helix bundle protein